MKTSQYFRKRNHECFKLEGDKGQKASRVLGKRGQIPFELWIVNFWHYLTISLFCQKKLSHAMCVSTKVCSRIRQQSPI